MKVGDLVQLSAYGKSNSYYAFRNAQYGIILDIVDDQVLMRGDTYKVVVA